jgi:hypothetical protein
VQTISIWHVCKGRRREKGARPALVERTGGRIQEYEQWPSKAAISLLSQRKRIFMFLCSELYQPLSHVTISLSTHLQYAMQYAPHTCVSYLPCNQPCQPFSTGSTSNLWPSSTLLWRLESSIRGLGRRRRKRRSLTDGLGKHVVLLLCFIVSMTGREDVDCYCRAAGGSCSSSIVTRNGSY